MKKKTLLEKLQERREDTLLALIDTVDFNAKSVYQHRLAEIDMAIIDLKRSQ